MRAFAAVSVLTVAAFSWNAATAFPDGAPWGAANPAVEQNCATCHFDNDPVLDSAALVIDGLPAIPQPGAKYDLTLSFDDSGIVTAGFQLFAQMAEQQAGLLVSTADNVEFIGSAIRSTSPVSNDTGVNWSIEWRAPVAIESQIDFFVAATSANDDGSPFGDIVHFRSYRLPTE